MKILILGLGNVLLCDEGVGVHVAHALLKKGVPVNVTVIDIGTAILDALPELEKADAVILVDALKAEGTAGTVYRLDFDKCVKKGYIASMHGFDIASVFGIAQIKIMPKIVVIGIEPGRIEFSMELSPEVACSVQAAVMAVEEEVGSLLYDNKKTIGQRSVTNSYIKNSDLT